MLALLQGFLSKKVCFDFNVKHADPVCAVAVVGLVRRGRLFHLLSDLCLLLLCDDRARSLMPGDDTRLTKMQHNSHTSVQ